MYDNIKYTQSDSVLTSDPDAEPEEVEVSLSLYRIPTQVRVAFLYQLAVALQSAPRQVHSDLLQVMFSGNITHTNITVA